MSIHKPVLLKEVVDLLNFKPGITVIDATLGGGGYSDAILGKILPGGKLIAIDQDNKAIISFKNYLNSLKPSLEKENVILVRDNFARLEDIILSLKIKKVDAIIADLGISSDQLNDPERGFSFLKDGPLDMRMNRDSKITAFDVVNTYAEKKLSRILREYGEEHYAKKIAKAITENRRKKLIDTTFRLVAIIESAIPEHCKHQKIHPATRTFQALRIEVNNEPENLKKFLSEAIEVLSSRGKIAIISFHSGEDSIVKKYLRENARGCVLTPEEIIYGRRGAPVLKIVTKKPIRPSLKEIAENPRARSAKLRIAEKI